MFVNKDFKLEGIVVGVDVNIILLDEFGIFFKFLIIKSEFKIGRIFIYIFRYFLDMDILFLNFC